MKEMRAVFAEKLIELAKEDERIVLLEADLMRATGTTPFKEIFPDRIINCGVAEANMVGVAAGLSASGKIPFASTFACFAARRAYDQFFLSGNYAQQNIKLVGSDPGILAALNGGTHMPFEDVGLMRNIPGLVVFEPCDGTSLAALVSQSKDHKGCTYMRLNRKTSPAVYEEGESFELGKGKVIRDGNDVALIASGTVMVPEALKAATELEKEGVSAAVIDMHTIKPIDAELVLEYAKKTGAIVTCENHQIVNGLGSAVAEVLCENLPTPMVRVGINDLFGQVGDVAFLQEAYGLTAENIKTKAYSLLKNRVAMRS
jgi:transketolase